MILVCSNCNTDVCSGPLRDGLCGPCHHAATGKGEVFACIDCKRTVHDMFARQPDGTCQKCSFWRQHATLANDPCSVRVGGKHYRILAEGDGPCGPAFRGFGGARFDIEFLDGRRVTTRNLWHQGTIPEHFRGRLPDNAKFIYG